ncbi:MAG: hypothetical protein WC635_16450 [Bacteriovorax sp.]
MKKLMMIGSVLSLLSSSAFATQARLLALGMNETDNEGMYYISDARNIFLNPAYVNIYADYAVFEYGSSGLPATVIAGTASAATLNGFSTPKAQGGAFKRYGDFVYGVYLGNESNTSALLRIAGTSAIATFDGATAPAGTNAVSKMLQTADNQVDFFFGGDNGLKWAVNPTFSTGKDETRNAKDSAAAIRLGAIASNWDAHANISLRSKAEASETIAAAGLGVGATTVTQEFKGKLGLQVGGSYALSENNKVFGYVKNYGWEQSDSFTNYGGALAALGGQTGTVKGNFTSYYLGWGSDFSVNNGDKVYTSVGARKTDIDLKFTRKSEVRHLIVPVVIGYEAKATDWLTLRGSFVQNVYGQSNNKNINNVGATGTQINPVGRTLVAALYGGTGVKTVANSTTVNAGASLNFGKLTLDGLLGTTSSAGVANSKTGVFSVDNLLTSVAAVYNF